MRDWLDRMRRDVVALAATAMILVTLAVLVPLALIKSLRRRRWRAGD